MCFLLSSYVGKIISCSWLVFLTPPAVLEDVRFCFCKTAKNPRLSREANSSLMRLGREIAVKLYGTIVDEKKHHSSPLLYTSIFQLGCCLILKGWCFCFSGTPNIHHPFSYFFGRSRYRNQTVANHVVRTCWGVRLFFFERGGSVIGSWGGLWLGILKIYKKLAGLWYFQLNPWLDFLITINPFPVNLSHGS